MIAKKDRSDRLKERLRKGICELNIREFPVNLRNRFKAWCAAKGLTMQEGAVLLVEKAVENDED